MTTHPEAPDARALEPLVAFLRHESDWGPLGEVISVATGLGCDWRLLCGPASRELRLLVSVTTADAESRVILRRWEHGRWEGEPLLAPSPGAEDAWDFPARLRVLEDRYFLELSRGGEMHRVPMAPAGAALTATYGWSGSSPEYVAEAVLRRDVVGLALTQFLGIASPHAAAPRVNRRVLAVLVAEHFALTIDDVPPPERKADHAGS